LSAVYRNPKTFSALASGVFHWIALAAEISHNIIID
jgi:hypothetical protein